MKDWELKLKEKSDMMGSSMLTQLTVAVFKTEKWEKARVYNDNGNEIFQVKLDLSDCNYDYQKYNKRREIISDILNGNIDSNMVI